MTVLLKAIFFTTIKLQFKLKTDVGYATLQSTLDIVKIFATGRQTLDNVIELKKKMVLM